TRSNACPTLEFGAAHLIRRCWHPVGYCSKNGWSGRGSGRFTGFGLRPAPRGDGPRRRPAGQSAVPVDLLVRVPGEGPGRTGLRRPWFGDLVPAESSRVGP